MWIKFLAQRNKRWSLGGGGRSGGLNSHPTGRLIFRDNPDVLLYRVLFCFLSYNKTRTTKLQMLGQSTPEFLGFKMTLKTCLHLCMVHTYRKPYSDKIRRPDNAVRTNSCLKVHDTQGHQRRTDPLSTHCGTEQWHCPRSKPVFWPTCNCRIDGPY